MMHATDDLIHDLAGHAGHGGDTASPRRFLLAGVIMIVANIFDFIDGKVAQITNTVSRFGAFWDSTLDRFSDIALFLGLIYLYAGMRRTDYVMVGEANYSLDPLSSTGVEKALQSALIGAAVVNTLLNYPERSKLCTQFYRDRQQEAVTTHTAWMNQYYREVERYAGEPFWSARRAAPVLYPNEPRANQLPQPRLTTSVRLAPDVCLTTEPCVINDEIATRPGLRAPSLTRPLVFLNGIEVSLLLADLPPSPKWQDLLASWSRLTPPASAQRVAKWLWEKRILCEATGL